MKKKSPRGIPDFSRHSTRPKDAGTPDQTAPSKAKSKSMAPPPRAKPASTSSKSGQRGQ